MKNNYRIYKTFGLVVEFKATPKQARKAVEFGDTLVKLNGNHRRELVKGFIVYEDAAMHGDPIADKKFRELMGKTPAKRQLNKHYVKLFKEGTF